MITICCVFVKGHVRDFRECGPLYVQNLASMVRRHMDRPYRFVCLSDYGGRLYGRNLEVVKIPPTATIPRQHRIPRGYPAGDKVFAWWSKLELFNPAHGFSGRMLYLDLDTLVVDSLAPILDYPADFALVPDEGMFQGKWRRRVVKRFNSSVMVWDAGCARAQKVWVDYTPETPLDLWGDQDAIGQSIPDAAAMPLEWFPRISSLERNAPKPPVKVVLCKWPKNVVAAQQYPWVKEVWI